MSRAATSSWAPFSVSTPSETSAGVSLTTGDERVRDTTTLKPWARRSSMVASSAGRVSSAS